MLFSNFRYNMCEFASKNVIWYTVLAFIKIVSFPDD